MEFDGFDGHLQRPCLLVVADVGVRGDAARVAAAVDCVVLERNLPVGKLVEEPSSLRLDWERAGVVLLDVDTAATMLALRPTRRAGVVILTRVDPTVDHWRAATAIGAADVLRMPDDEETLVRILASGANQDRGDGGVIAVVGARGGVGASTLAAATALTAATDARTLLVDCDAYGGGLDLLLGWEEDPGLRWSGIVVEAGRISGDALHGALPSRGMLSVLAAARVRDQSSTGGIAVTAAAAVVDSGRRSGDLVICDVPRLPGPLSDAVHDAADLVVLLVQADLGSVAAAENIAGYLSSRNSNVGLVVRGPAPGGLRGAEIADALQLPLLASVRPEPGLARQVERGGLRLGRRSPLGSAARTILRTFARKPQTSRAA
nr:septum site-determining protein Ssd [Rhodococcus sp. (in: high G+C Gram-positive bacteria)]